MDVLLPDMTTPGSERLAAELERRGHNVRSCRERHSSPVCSALRGLSCPLDDTGVDVTVAVGEPTEAQRGDGATCSVVRRVPLVLVDPHPSDPLIDLASAVTTCEEAVREAEHVAAEPLQVHTRRAEEVVEAELNRAGLDRTDASVAVRRRQGTLVVELWHSDAVSRERAQRMGTHCVQAVRLFDPWARQLDVVVHRAQRT